MMFHSTSFKLRKKVKHALVPNRNNNNININRHSNMRGNINQVSDVNKQQKVLDNDIIPCRIHIFNEQQSIKYQMIVDSKVHSQHGTRPYHTNENIVSTRKINILQLNIGSNILMINTKRPTSLTLRKELKDPTDPYTPINANSALPANPLFWKLFKVAAIEGRKREEKGGGSKVH